MATKVEIRKKRKMGGFANERKDKKSQSGTKNKSGF